MPPESAAILLGLTYLVFKHMLGDFFLQTAFQYRNKGTYGHPGGLLHALIHIGLTAPVFFIIAPESWLAGLLILLGEFVVHYHVDWMKEKVVTARGLGVTDAMFWYALGVDQLCHHLTYIAIVAVLVMGGA